MRALIRSLRRALRFPRGDRRRFMGYLMLSLAPFLIIALGMNLHFVQQRLEDSARIVQGVSRQADGQIDALYDMADVLATNVRVHTNLQNDVLSRYNRDNSYLALNRNFLKIQELINTYMFFEDFMDLRFYLPDALVVPNGTFLLDVAAIEAEPWYESFVETGNIRRWYLADREQGSGANDVFCTVRPIQDPMNYSEVIGYLRVDISLSRIREIVDFSRIMDGTSCFLVDGSEGVIWHDGPMDAATLESFDWAGCTDEYAVIAGQKYLLAAHPVSTSTMTLVYLVPQMSLAKDILMNCTLQIVLLLLEIALLTAIAAMFAGSLLSSKNNRLRLLNEQINPHFLYNTLDMINWQAISRNLPDIYRPIQSLSRFYKISLNHGSDFIRVCDEVEHMRLYLELQNIRFKDGITYQIEVDPAVRECFILHMVLQPIVENSVVHGIREKDSLTGNLRIAIAGAHGDLEITIADDGVGMDEAAAGQLLRGDSSVGYGLSNIQQRIRLYFGKHYGLTIRSAPGVGTTVRVALPRILKEPASREL